MNEQSVAEIRKKIETQIEQVKNEVTRWQEIYDGEVIAVKEWEEDWIDKTYLKKNYLMKLELIKKDMEKEFEPNFYISNDDFRIKTYKSFRGIQIDAHMEQANPYDNDSEFYGMNKERIHEKCSIDEDIKNKSRISLRRALKLKFKEDKVNEYLDELINGMSDDWMSGFKYVDGNPVYESDSDEFWENYDDGIKRHIKELDPKIDKGNELYGAIKRNQEMENMEYENILKKLAFYKRRVANYKSDLNEKVAEFEDLKNELHYLNQIEKKYF